MIQVRRLILDTYSDMSRKVTKEWSTKILKVTFPVIVSFIDEPNDSFTHDIPTIEDLNF